MLMVNAKLTAEMIDAGAELMWFDEAGDNTYRLRLLLEPDQLQPGMQLVVARRHTLTVDEWQCTSYEVLLGATLFRKGLKLATVLQDKSGIAKVCETLLLGLGVGAKSGNRNSAARTFEVLTDEV